MTRSSSTRQKTDGGRILKCNCTPTRNCSWRGAIYLALQQPDVPVGSHGVAHDGTMQNDTSTTHGQFLHSFDGLRSVAVVLVLLQHLSFLAKKYLGSHFAGGVFGLGDFRIDIFFVLSGFFAAWVAGRGHESQNPGIHFLGRRLRRLLPLLWFLISVKLALIFSLNLAGRHEGLDWFQVLRSYTLLPAPGYPIILPAWTLSFELVFCALWSVLLCFSQRIRLAAMGVWVLAILSYGMIDVRPSMSLPGFVMHPYFLDFIAGVLLAEIALFRSIKLRGSMIMLIGGGLLVIAMALQPELKDYPELLRRIVWGGAAFVVGLFTCGNAKTPTSSCRRACACWLGPATASISPIASCFTSRCMAWRVA